MSGLELGSRRVCELGGLCRRGRTAGHGLEKGGLGGGGGEGR